MDRICLLAVGLWLRMQEVTLFQIFVLNIQLLQSFVRLVFFNLCVGCSRKAFSLKNLDRALYCLIKISILFKLLPVWILFENVNSQLVSALFVSRTNNCTFIGTRKGVL